MLVSVVIPTCNRATLLPATLDSVLAQTGADLEVIVVDDGSTDDTAAVLARYPAVRSLTQSNQGVSAARNAGIAASRGEVLTFVDSDDLWDPDHVQALLTHLPQADLVHGLRQDFLDPGIERPWFIPEWALQQPDPLFCLGTAAVWRTVWDRVGGFDAAMTRGEDTDWWHRAKALQVRMLQIDKVLLRRRVHGSNLCYRQHEGSLQLVRANLRRKRGTA